MCTFNKSWVLTGTKTIQNTVSELILKSFSFLNLCIPTRENCWPFQSPIIVYCYNFKTLHYHLPGECPDGVHHFTNAATEANGTHSTELVTKVTHSTELVTKVTHATELVTKVTHSTELVTKVTHATELVTKVISPHRWRYLRVPSCNSIYFQ